MPSEDEPRRDTEKLYNAVCEQLKKCGKVTREEFNKLHAELGLPKGREADAWSKICTGVECVSRHFGPRFVRRAGKEGSGLYRDPQSSGTLPENPNFQPHEDEAAKRHIGGVVARFLHKSHDRDRGIVIGSGTACLHVGLAMRELAIEKKTPYKQNNIFTTNVVVATEWGRGAETYPARELHIPEGVLELEQLRFKKIFPPKLNLTFSIAVLGAHGCLLQPDGTAHLYSGWESTAEDNQWFLDRVLWCVIACLPSTKLEGTEVGASGAIFEPKPDSKITKYLVTDRLPRDRLKLTSLDGAGWKIVTTDDDWDRAPGWWKNPTHPIQDSSTGMLPISAEVPPS